MTLLHRRPVLALLFIVLAAELAVGQAYSSEVAADTTDDHLEAPLRPVLPPFIIDALRSVRFPGGATMAADLAQTAGIGLGPAAGSIPTDSLLDLISLSYAERADVNAYLRLRLFDLLVGDWSRLPADIRWVKDDMVGRWIPVARDYRNAFPRFRGALPRAILLASETMTDFSESYPPSERASSHLRTLDRRLLGVVSAADWDSVTLDLRTRLETSARVRADAWSANDPEFSSNLRRRVSTIASASEELRRSINRWVALFGTDADDSVFVRVRQGHLATVTIGPRGSSRTTDELLFHSAGTQEIRLVMGRGNDVVVFEGTEPLMAIEVVSQGNTSLLSRPTTGGPWRTKPPLRVKEHRVTARPRIDLQDWGTVTSFAPWLDLDSDDGLFVGGGPVTTTFGFGHTPYATKNLAKVGIASSTLGIRAKVAYDTREWWDGVGVLAGLRFAQADVTKFFGNGNETMGASSAADIGQYEGRRRDLEIMGGLDVPLGPSIAAGVLLRLTSSAISAKSGTVIDSMLSSGETRSLNFATSGISMTYDTRGNALLPADAVFLSASFESSPAILQNRRPFTRTSVDGMLYVSVADTSAVVVGRFAGESMSGDPPWFEAAAIGGSHSLRGFERERFRGQSSLVTGIEVRIPGWTIPFIWPHETGYIVFAETGRVFVRGDASHRWHGAVGAGGWIRPVRAPHLVSATLARSAEDWKISATLGFAF